eukprot:NODE_2860_length_1325_cov_42.707155_g2716_i0.p1 GENE.NODE_2860_length_1325_cov_42.707155_g2716_i0~~NODE_2860_length_1325_cov_42.707155_g2716_i0.p1  ORF type:complete len:408 (+),score=93.14 NODE_2860_length_1325_cov_42.707155_g2716_i0:128-1225(+)
MSPIALPIVHSKDTPNNEGVFKTVMKIGGTEFHVIVDTCSSDMLLVGDTCDSCQTTDGVWAVNNSKAKDTGERSVVSFFSQTNQIHWYKDFIEAGPLRLPCKVGVIVANKSNMVNGGTLPGRSIMGIFNRQASNKKGGGLLDSNDKAMTTQLFGPNGCLEHPVYSIAIEPSGHKGEMLLGALHSGIKGWVPFVGIDEKPALHHMPEMLIHVEFCAIVDEQGEVLRHLPLKYARVDTGNTWLSMPAAYWQHRGGPPDKVPEAAGMLFVLKNKLTLFFPVQMYTGPITLANATGFGGLAPDRSLSEDCCVIGNEVMKGMVLAVNMGTGELGFGGMTVSTNPHHFRPSRYAPPTHPDEVRLAGNFKEL